MQDWNIFGIKISKPFFFRVAERKIEEVPKSFERIKDTIENPPKQAPFPFKNLGKGNGY